jgi:hypothetical protein
MYLCKAGPLVIRSCYVISGFKAFISFGETGQDVFRKYIQQFWVTR